MHQSAAWAPRSRNRLISAFAILRAGADNSRADDRKVWSLWEHPSFGARLRLGWECATERQVAAFGSDGGPSGSQHPQSSSSLPCSMEGLPPRGARHWHMVVARRPWGEPSPGSDRCGSILTGNGQDRRNPWFGWQGRHSPFGNSNAFLTIYHRRKDIERGSDLGP
jgi:hypothetical protein